MATEEAVSKTQAMLRGVFEAATGESMLVFDRDATISLANTAALQALGMGTEELVGRPAALLGSIGSGRSWPAAIAEVVATGVPLELEDERQGSHFLHRLSPVRDEEGRVAWVAACTRDVTSRKRGEEALRFSIERYQKAFAINPAAISITTLERGIILDVNRTWVTLFGYSSEEALGSSVRKIKIWPTAAASKRFVAELVEKGCLHDWEQEFCKKSGEVIPVQLSAQILSLGAEKVVVTTMIDLTDRMRTEQALRDSELRYRMLAENNPDMIRRFDDQHRHLYMNPAGQEVCYKWFREEVVGKSCREVGIPDELEGRWEQSITRALAGERVSEHYSIADCKGQRRSIWDLFVPELASDGSVQSVLAISRDMTEMVEAQQALRESEERLRAMVMASSDALYRMAPDWSEMRELFGRSFVPDTEERTPGWLEKYVPAADQPRVTAAFREAVAGKKPFELEHRILRADGSVAWTLSRAVPLFDDRGKMVEWFGMARDITSRKEAEEELRKAHDGLERRVAERTALLENTVRELHEKEHMLLQQSRLAAMGEMISNIAHQWRQPLNSLGLLIQRLSLFYESELFSKELLDETVMKSMTLIKHMSGTIDDFRNFFKPDKEKVHFSLVEVVAAAIKLIESAFHSHGIALVLDQQADSVIYGYPSEYAQVVLNILSNAKDAFEARDTTDARVLMTVSTAGERSVLTVTDNAGGIPEEIISKVFDPHFTTKGTHGTGIGLFMSKNIIEKNMNGKLSVRNTTDGAEFRIEV